MAYPHDPDAIMQIVCLFPADLVNASTIQFVGGDVGGLRYEPTLTVSVNRLRNAFWWLAEKCWPWMEATKTSGLHSRSNLGERLESLLAAYVKSTDGTSQAVPVELLNTAVPMDLSRAPSYIPGPGDAIAGDHDDEDGLQESTDTLSTGQPLDTSAAVIDGGWDSISPMRVWNEAMQKFGVVQDCEHALATGDHSANVDDAQRAEHDRTIAMAAAVHALPRLSSEEARRKLDDFMTHAEGHHPTIQFPHAHSSISSCARYSSR